MIQEMQNRGLSPDSITFICTLKVGHIGCLEIGEEIREEVKKKDLLKKRFTWNCIGGYVCQMQDAE